MQAQEPVPTTRRAYRAQVAVAHAAALVAAPEPVTRRSLRGAVPVPSQRGASRRRSSLRPAATVSR